MKFPIKKIQTGMNNPILRQRSEEIEEISEDLVNFSDKLLDLMREHD
jgi:peptide deformylase